MGLPKRAEGNQLFKYSKVIGGGVTEPVCQNLNFRRYDPSDHVPLISWPTKRTAIEPSLQQKLLFREGQSRARPTHGARLAASSSYGFVTPFILGVGSVVIIVIVFLRVSRRRLAPSSPAVPAHL